MSFDFYKFLEVSKTIKNNSQWVEEQHFIRTGISRAYYSVFRPARDKIKRFDFYDFMSEFKGSHDEIVKVLKILGIKQRKIRSLPHIFETLRRLRVNADYKDEKLNKEDLEKAISHAERCHSLIKQIQRY
ncbi:HEPN domain-containing protein [Deferribacter autotrophicus]|uniref:HEPN domain-containing protein n=1 Tax=Deferribacter autotrophicus TaxID=500465 RepID=A0A5A8F296_9BACT|nr:HEPN domain-containing protein [Deferribacter autotrophicus]KAA0257555.1 HEPN domain-containing protein [Deferribacter autotrophicus]